MSETAMAEARQIYIDEDARDLGIHQSIENLVQAIMFANGFTRKEALSRLTGFVENDEETIP